MRTCWNPQFWQLFSTLTPGWKAMTEETVEALVCSNCAGVRTLTMVGAICLVVALRLAETTTPSSMLMSSSISKLSSRVTPFLRVTSRVWVLYPVQDTSRMKSPSGRSLRK